MSDRGATGGGGGRCELVGFAIPSAHRTAATWGTSASYPNCAGCYVDDLLGEITRVHAADGAERITAITDVLNTPMVAAFERGNYQVAEVRMVFRSPPG